MSQCSVVKPGKYPGFGMSLADGHFSMNYNRILSQYNFNFRILSFPPQAARVMQERANVFPCLPLITNIPMEAFLVALDTPGHNLIPVFLDHFSVTGLSLLPPSAGFLIVSEFVRELLFLHTGLLEFSPGFLFAGIHCS